MLLNTSSWRISPIIRTDTPTAFDLVLCIFGSLLNVFDRLTHGAFGCCGDVLHAKARCKYRNLYLIAKILVEGYSPFEDEVGAKLSHKLIYIVNFLHHEVRTLVVFVAKRDVEQ